MVLTTALSVALLAQAPAQPVEQVDVAFEQIASGENSAAIALLESHPELASDDPSRLINLGVAYAREGDVEKARELFRAALYSDDRQVVETSDGDWVDSRILARHALAELDGVDSARFPQVAIADTE